MSDSVSTKLRDEHNAKLEREIALDLEERQARWQNERNAYVERRGAELFDAWLESMRAQFRAEAGAEHDRQAPPWDFPRVADLRLQRQIPQPAHRAKTVERLTALHEATAPTRKPEPSTYLTAKQDTVLGTQGRQAR